MRRFALVTLTFVLILGSAGSVFAEPTMVSVKVVKTKASRCSTPPGLEFPTGSNVWRLVTKPFHSGENDWEIFFEIETDAAGVPSSEIVIVAPGAKARRVIVGKTDVSFRQEGDRIRFRLVDDRSRGQEMRVTHHSPRGGYPIHFLLNWKMRRAGKFAGMVYPEKQIAAIPNYLLAAQELFRVMGDMGPDAPKSFLGDIVLMGSEIAATRGHLDYPPHFHIMHYQFDKGPERNWLSRLVPHFYMDEEARIVRNNYGVLVGRGDSGELGLGDVCHFRDSAGTPILDLVIAKEGLLLKRPDGEVYSLRPDPKRGAAYAVYGFRGDAPVCRAKASDEPEIGRFSYRIDSIRNGEVIDTFRNGFRYDPFTAKVLN
jgi:hypothetical protein